MNATMTFVPRYLEILQWINNIQHRVVKVTNDVIKQLSEKKGHYRFCFVHSTIFNGGVVNINYYYYCDSY